MERHLQEVKSETHSNKHFSNKVKNIGADNVKLVILESVPYSDRWRAEKEWIEKISDEYRLTNRIHNGIIYSSFDYSNVDDNQKILEGVISKGKPKPANDNIQTCLDLAWDYLIKTYEFGKAIQNVKS